jgi:FkbM family methyltransferase
VTDWLLSELDADSVVWDVGTHVGWFASVAAAAIGSAGAVHAFDLDDSALASGAANAALNAGSTPVTTVHAAVSDTTADSVAYEPYLEDAWTPFGGPDRAVNAVTEERSGTLGSAETLRLDDYLETAAPPDIVKIDVEGHELATLQGFQRLGEIQPTLILAIHPAQLRDQDADPADVYDLLGRHGYVDLETLAEDDGYGPEPVRTVVATP